MKHAWVKHNGRTLPVTVQPDGDLLTTAGAHIKPGDVAWCAPPHGTMIALGLNYVDHAAELQFTAPEEPLLFLKTASTVVGHGAEVMRPDEVAYMHYECELVAVIGKTARKVTQQEAMDYVAGYTLCNDYAIRDYLENYYRPNLRVKNRDTLTVLGPYIVDKEDIPDPQNLALRTYVNGEIKQQGHTQDMIFSITFLIEYLSACMTLVPGDMISTGTPKGLSNVVPGDEVSIEIEHIGRLTSYIISEQEYLEQRNAP